MLFLLLATVFAAALQDMAPSFGGAKPPLLALLALHVAFRQRVSPSRNRLPAREGLFAARWLVAAAFMGCFEDALGPLPFGCATAFTVLACSAARLLREEARGLPPALLGLFAAFVAAPLHELWLAVWGVVDLPASVLAVRFCASALPASAAGALLFAALPWLEEHVGFEGPAGRAA